MKDEWQISQHTFVTCLTLGPTLSASMLPTLLFGLTLGEWGSNLIWGSYFGLGWCLSALWSGSIVHDSFSTWVGFAWGWLAIIPLALISSRLWRVLNARRRRRVLIAVGASLVLCMPSSLMLSLDGSGVHLPDYTTHMVTSY